MSFFREFLVNFNQMITITCGLPFFSKNSLSQDQNFNILVELLEIIVLVEESLLLTSSIRHAACP
jgi:hypothetical protein